MSAGPRRSTRMSAPTDEGAAPKNASQTLFRCLELADILEASFTDPDFNETAFGDTEFTFVPVE